MSSGDAQSPGAVEQSVRLSLRFLTALLLLSAIAWLGSGITQIQPGYTAVVMRFGRIDREHPPGLLWAWPRPFEEVRLAPGREAQLSQDIGRFDALNDNYLLTGDAGVVHVRATIMYNVVTPRAFVVMRDRVPAALERLFSSAVTQACAERSLDGVMVARVERVDGGDSRTVDEALAAREHLRGDLAAAIERGATQLGLGITINRIDLVSMLPDKAQSAFANVSTAESAAASEIAAARTASERQHQDASAMAEKIKNDAEAHGREVETRARVATNAIAALDAERDPQRRSLLFTRLYHERIDSILRRCGGITTLAADGHLSVVVPAR